MAEGIISQHNEINETHTTNNTSYPTYVTNLTVRGMIAYVLPGVKSGTGIRPSFTFTLDNPVSALYTITPFYRTSADPALADDATVYMIERGKYYGGYNHIFQLSEDGTQIKFERTTWSYDIYIIPIYSDWLIEINH